MPSAQLALAAANAIEHRANLLLGSKSHYRTLGTNLLFGKCTVEEWASRLIGRKQAN